MFLKSSLDILAADLSEFLASPLPFAVALVAAGAVGGLGAVDAAPDLACRERGSRESCVRACPLLQIQRYNVRVRLHCNESDVASRCVHRESNLMFTISSTKNQKKIVFAFAYV